MDLDLIHRISYIQDVLGGSFAKAIQHTDGVPDQIVHQELYDVLSLDTLDANRLNNVKQGQPQYFGFANPMSSYGPASKV